MKPSFYLFTTILKLSAIWISPASPDYFRKDYSQNATEVSTRLFSYIYHILHRIVIICFALLKTMLLIQVNCCLKRSYCIKNHLFIPCIFSMRQYFIYKCISKLTLYQATHTIASSHIFHHCVYDKQSFQSPCHLRQLPKVLPPEPCTYVPDSEVLYQDSEKKDPFQAISYTTLSILLSDLYIPFHQLFSSFQSFFLFLIVKSKLADLS